MQLHQITSTTKQKNRKRIGRGGKRGTYSGRGLKGQKSRAGAGIRPAYRDILKQLPKKRGYKFKSIQIKPAVVNLIDIDENFKDNEIISPQTLLDRGLISKYKGRLPEVKILGDGETKKKFTVKNCLASENVKKKIEKAGGQIM